MDAVPNSGASVVARGDEWVSNRASTRGSREGSAHTSPRATVPDRSARAKTVHVSRMSDSLTDLDPFEMWDEVELSARTGFHVRKIQRWRKDGGGPPFILEGKKPRYRAVSVLRWLEACEQASDRMAS